MGAVGSCFDNAVAETFFATLTKELLLHNTPKGGWATRAELRSAIFEFIEGYYNPTRLHSTLGCGPRPRTKPTTPPATATASCARARAKHLCTTFGCAQLRRQQQPDSTKPGEVHTPSFMQATSSGILPGGCDRLAALGLLGGPDEQVLRNYG